VLWEPRKSLKWSPAVGAPIGLANLTKEIQYGRFQMTALMVGSGRGVPGVVTRWTGQSLTTYGRPRFNPWTVVVGSRW